MNKEQEQPWQPVNHGRAPFVRWPARDSPETAMLAGHVVGVWEGKYDSDVARVELNECVNVEVVTGSGEKQVITTPEPGDSVNVPLNFTALEAIDEAFVGRELRIQFAGWAKSKAGHPYRDFRISVRDAQDGLPF